MAFETISEYIDDIEQMLAKGNSPHTIAKALGIPTKRVTIYRYKQEVFDPSTVANADWLTERQKTTGERLEEGAARIVDDLELLNLMKLRSETLLELKIGDSYTTAAGEPRTISYSAAAALWDTGTRIGIQAVKQSLEIAGDDPVSRKTDTLLELINNVERRERGRDGKADQG